MNNHPSPKLAIISPTSAATVFFSLFAFFFFLFTKLTLAELALAKKIPFFTGLVGSVITGGFVGYLFGNLLVKAARWQRLVIIGLLIGIITLLLASIDILLYLVLFEKESFKVLTHWQDYFVVYGMINLSVFFILAPWLLPLIMAATVYFNKLFYPRLLLAQNSGSSGL